MKKFTCVQDIGDLKIALAEAFEIKKDRFKYVELGRNKTLMMIFFNSSLRTRLSTQKAALNLGMNVIVLDINQGAWKLETERGVIMDGDKPEHLLDTVLFIDARNYYTVVDRTQNEWSDWQLKNLNAIVWLYRGEVDKYKGLLAEYHAELADDRPFAEIQAALEQNVQAKREEAKAAVEAAPRKERKATQEKFDKALEALNEKLTVAKEAVWLTEKFGEGVYQDIPGLCKVASRDTILNEKGASLTPGAYVGVAPVEDDGVDFAKRMTEIHEELLTLQAESNELMQTISRNMKEMGI